MERLRGNLPILLIWLAVCALLVLITRSQIMSGFGWDPDDQLRMVQLRDWLNGQGWFDTTQYRIGEPDSQPMHWPRWIELPLALVFLLLKPLVGAATAETAAMVIVPLVTLGIAMWLVAKITEQVFDRPIAILAATLTATAVPIVAQIRPMRVDHHGWQIVLALAALWTMFWPDKRKGGIALGVALALWLSISLEGLPISAAFIVLLVWRWLFRTEEGVRLFWTLLSFLIASFLLYLGSQGWFDIAISYCDALSPAHLLACAAGAAIILPAIKWLPANIPLRVASLAVAGLPALAIFYALAPQCVGGAFNTMDPLVREYWLVNVLEGLPIWYQNGKTMVTLLGGSIIVGLGSLIYIVWTRPDRIDGSKLFILGYAFLWALLLSLFVQRATAVAAAFALPFLGWAVHRAFVWARGIKRVPARIFATAAVVLLIMPGPLAVALFNGVGDDEQKPENSPENAMCRSDESLARLNALPRSNILAPFDFGPRILLLTPHSVLATSHHRNDQAMGDQIRIFTASPDEARPLMEAHNIRYIVTCDGEAELGIYAKKHPDGLWAGLAKDEKPDWLQSVHIRDNGLRIWRVTAKGLPNDI
ncbi:hypothetical protein [Sphingorhabdus sp. YGSMI21]|uniref:hypothetical protein n=1 Tax=Sphingorhabdus sp. YGSMI21 TaxID=2077182 RepID=UPI000C1E7690|nr:hypothetical protein [Sphingorhabdus sp. YGSMI21]ATW02534.1 hypothetical protein CHN51_02605 [Sphingorhabdus sp. YGSMI21]